VRGVSSACQGGLGNGNGLGWAGRGPHGSEADAPAPIHHRRAPMQSRAQHLEWCKKRALAYVDQGYMQQALSSMISDLRKHPKTADHSGIQLATYGMAFGDLTTKDQVREFIQGFN
jgi:hypothetical protein